MDEANTSYDGSQQGHVFTKDVGALWLRHGSERSRTVVVYYSGYA